MIGNTVNIDHIFEKLTKQVIPGTYFNIEEVIEWTYEVLIAIGNDMSFEKETLTLNITDYKARLPLQIYELLQVINDDDKELTLATNKKDLVNEFDYVIHNGFIYINNDSISITLLYNSMMTDDEDRPLIPDEMNIIEAVVAYSQSKMSERAFYQGKLDPNKLSLIKQDYYWKIKKAQASPKMSILKDSKRFARIFNKNFF